MALVSSVFAQTVSSNEPTLVTRSPAQIADVKDAIVFTINNANTSGIFDSHAIDMAERAGTDVVIRGWFKWNWAPTLDPIIPEYIHQYGALFGGGITCSVLFEGENRLTHNQVLDMVTRDSAGNLVPWPLHASSNLNVPIGHHGSLSSPAYLEYLFRWSRDQIDAGADYLFMDEADGALNSDGAGANEGFDDYSLRDFQTFLLEVDPATKGWTATDPRWKTHFVIDLSDRAMCPDGSISSFNYRAYLKAKGFVNEPFDPANRLASTWTKFSDWRNDRSWQSLVDRIHAYAHEKGRRVFLSANGEFPYVDLQVVNNWKEDEQMEGAHKIDLSQSAMPRWRAVVVDSRNIAGAPIPVVIFHDWGGTFEWLGIPPAERNVWMRTRGAEIYAAGGFFAFPLQGPGQDAETDGTLPTVSRQSAFYHLHRDLYLHGRFLGLQTVQTSAPDLSLAIWSTADASTLLIHVINRKFTNEKLQPRRDLVIKLPIDQLPTRSDAISPDWSGEHPLACVLVDSKLSVTLKDLDAYDVLELHYDKPIPLDPFRDKHP